MHLGSLARQSVRLAGERIDFEPGEPIVTEHCHKCTPASFAAPATRAGWQARASWSDERALVSVLYLDRS